MFNENLKELRVLRGLTQAELGKEVGVSQGAIYFWEKGINEPTAGYLIKLALFFGVSVDELLSFSIEEGIKTGDSAAEMLSYFKKLSAQQKEILLATAKEMLK